MNWLRARIAFWTVLILSILGALYLGSTGVLVEPFLTFVLIVEGTLVAEMALYEIMKKRESAEIEITSTMKETDLGFKVSTKNKTIKSARVRCNNRNYDWDLGEKGVSKEVDLFVGDEPVPFYPFSTKVRWLRLDEIQNEPVTPFHALESSTPKTTEGGFLFTITEKTTGQEVWRWILMVPKETKALTYMNWGTSEMRVPVSIRIVGEGLEEKRDYEPPVVFDHLNIIAKAGDWGPYVISYGFRLGKPFAKRKTSS